jgi:hypothetical protein
MNVISSVHRYLGETMLLIALVGVILAIAGLVRKKKLEPAERIFGFAYAGLLDLQALLGLIQFIWLLSRVGSSLLSWRYILHPVLTVLAVIVVHGSRSWRESPMPLRHRAQLGAYGVSLLLIFAGRMLFV